MNVTLPRPHAAASASSQRASARGVWSLVFCFTLLLGGCASTNLVRVEPWQRGTLADYTMRPDRDPLNTMMSEHVYFSRETATGGRGVGGSGCGCN